MRTPWWGRDRTDVSPMTGTLGLFQEEGLKTKEEAGPTPHAIETQKEASQLVVVSRSRRELRLSHILGGSPRFALQPEDYKRKTQHYPLFCPVVTIWNGWSLPILYIPLILKTLTKWTNEGWVIWGWGRGEVKHTSFLAKFLQRCFLYTQR